MSYQQQSPESGAAAKARPAGPAADGIGSVTVNRGESIELSGGRARTKVG
jgi:hypothetical protein